MANKRWLCTPGFPEGVARPLKRYAYVLDVLLRRQYLADSVWSVSNVPVDWFGETLIPGTAFLSFETVLYNVVVLGCPIGGCRIAYSKRRKTGGGMILAPNRWIRHISGHQQPRALRMAKELPEIKFDDDGYSQVLISAASKNFQEFRFYIRKFQAGYIIQTVRLGVAMTGILSLENVKEAAEALLSRQDETDDLLPM